MLVLFAGIAAAVPLFVVNGLRLNRYASYADTAIRLDAGTRAEVEEMRSRFLPRFTAQLALGIGLIVLAAGVLVFLSLTNRVIAIRFAVLFLLVVGVSAFLFATAGTLWSAFDILLDRGDYRNKARHKKMAQIIGTIASVYWPVITAIYLLWSFVGGGWDISWVVWPVSGVVFAAIAGGIGTWFSLKEK